MDPAEPLPGVHVKPLKRFTDPRGWLSELFREDELPEGFRPAMAYLSVTHPGVARGPHEHVHQTDGFAFISGTYELYLWENRPALREPQGDAPRNGSQHGQVKLTVGEANPVMVLVPPGVVHAYKNVGDREAFVLNFPDQLYAGRGKKEPVDEIRHESEADSPFKLP